MPAAPKVTRIVSTAGQYAIQVQPGLLDEIGTLLRGLVETKKAALVSDEVVGPIYAARVESSLKSAGFDVIRASVPAGENHKTLITVSSIYDQLLTGKIERNTPVLALGGGVVGDMAGFAAATILRGVPLVQIPTTLLAMVDASIGGKTGVNHSSGKNLIGAFHQPIAVFIDPSVLKTLPRDQISSGLAEGIKHDVIRDADGFADLETNIHRAMNLDIDYLAGLIAHNAAIKSRIVDSDPFEKGERAHLNFGHTFGHAIETVFQYQLSHGQCVALGMCAASKLAVDLQMLDESDRRRIVALIRKAGLQTEIPSLDPGPIIEAMGFDKKVKAGKWRFVLPDRIGHVIIRDDVPIGLVRQAIQSLKG